MKYIWLIFLYTAVIQAETKEQKNYFNRIVDAIYHAEGGTKSSRPFGITTVKCKTFEEYRRVCYNTVRNSYNRWNGKGDFIAFLGSTYTPTKGVSRSTAKLNKNWVKNVHWFLDKQHK